MDLVSVFSQHIVTLQNVFLDDLQRLPGSWNLMSWSLQSRFARFACYSSDYWLGELLLVFFYKANPPPQSWKSKQWYPGSSMGFSGTDFPCFSWGLWNEDTSSMFGLGKHHCKLWCPRGSVLITSEPCENLQSYCFISWVPQFNGSLKPLKTVRTLWRTGHGLFGDKHDIDLQRIAMLLNYAVRPLGTIYNTIQHIYYRLCSDRSW